MKNNKYVDIKSAQENRQRRTRKIVIIFATLFSMVYISWWFRFSNVGNPYLYAILLVGEIYYLLMTIGYWFTVYDTSYKEAGDPTFYPNIDIFIPVCGEPIEIVSKTIECALDMNYDGQKVRNFPDRVKLYILNDGFVAKRENWREIDGLSSLYPVKVITRTIPGGAKAGNINNALKETFSEYLIIFDADMKPYDNFLTKTLGYFSDAKVGMVQTPQYYENHDQNFVTGGSWAQQELFFGPILMGKNRVNAVFCCGTNVVFKRKALEDVNGFDTLNIAEDFATSVNIHSQGWKTVYNPNYLARGLAPMDLQQYYSQQLRWAKGSIDVFFKNNPFFKKNLTFAQRVQYLLSLGYYLMGTFMIVDALIPVIYLYTGIIPVRGSSTSYLLLFVPYVMVIIYILSQSTNGKLNYRALQFSIGSFYIQMTALYASLTNKKIGFKVTSKEGDDDKERSYFKLVWPHLAYTALGLSAIIYSIDKHGLDPALITNASWILFNIIMISAHIYAAFPVLQKMNAKVNSFFESFTILPEMEQWDEEI